MRGPNLAATPGGPVCWGLSGADGRAPNLDGMQLQVLYACLQLIYQCVYRGGMRTGPAVAHHTALELQSFTTFHNDTTAKIQLQASPLGLGIDEQSTPRYFCNGLMQQSPEGTSDSLVETGEVPAQAWTSTSPSAASRCFLRGLSKPPSPSLMLPSPSQLPLFLQTHAKSNVCSA